LWESLKIPHTFLYFLAVHEPYLAICWGKTTGREGVIEIEE
jgi:hypothetical protein